MKTQPSLALIGVLAVANAAIILDSPDKVVVQAPVTLSRLPRIATVDERFQSYNVEMAEVIGGNFWKPYDRGNRRRPQTVPAVTDRQSALRHEEPGAPARVLPILPSRRSVATTRQPRHSSTRLCREQHGHPSAQDVGARASRAVPGEGRHTWRGIVELNSSRLYED